MKNIYEPDTQLYIDKCQQEIADRQSYLIEKWKKEDENSSLLPSPKVLQQRYHELTSDHIVKIWSDLHYKIIMSAIPILIIANIDDHAWSVK